MADTKAAEWGSESACYPESANVANRLPGMATASCRFCAPAEGRIVRAFDAVLVLRDGFPISPGQRRDRRRSEVFRALLPTRRNPLAPGFWLNRSPDR